MEMSKKKRNLWRQYSAEYDNAMKEDWRATGKRRGT